MYKAFLIKYSEIGLKGKNKYLFENSLIEQIKKSLKDIGEFNVSKTQGRVYVECPDIYDYDGAIEALKSVFGIAWICPVKILDSTDFEIIKQSVGEFVDKKYSNKDFTFKVGAKREDKRYHLTSPEICAQLGGYLLELYPEMKVDVHKPELLIMVEVRDKTYIYSENIKGLGGMPVGSNGKAMLLLSGGIDSPVAGYLIAKRGVAIDAVYFHAPPYTSERAKQKVVDLAKLLSNYTGPIKLHVVNFTDIQLYIYDQCPHNELTIIMRRYMMKIAENISNQVNAIGLITGESIGQVASQTLQSLAVTNEVCDMPIFRPLIGFDKQDIIEISKRINTYETSILPYEDCCTIFVAKHPATKPKLSRIRISEKKLEEKIDDLLEEAIETREEILVSE